MQHITTVKLHKRPDLFHKTAALLSEEWPGLSRATRLSCFERSCDTLPCHFVLVTAKDDVVAHCVLRVGIRPVDDTIGRVAVAYSVVVAADARHMGLGQRIMAAAETHARQLGVTFIYLTSESAGAFYKKLGYTVTVPFNLVVGGDSVWLRKQLIDKLPSQPVPFEQLRQQVYVGICRALRLFAALVYRELVIQWGCENLAQ